VDDEPLVLIGLQGMLEWEKLGYTVCGTARNGKLALELIEREKPDIVIADVKMPVMDGLTLARTCRERNATLLFYLFGGLGKGGLQVFGGQVQLDQIIHHSGTHGLLDGRSRISSLPT